jgi:DNA repair exonuclease SbcCD nuclease subunit
MSVLWCSDLHIKPASVVRKRTLSDDAFYALDQIESVATIRGVTAVILGGDVYDSSTPGGEAVNRMAAFIRNLNSVGIEVYYIEGNHDRINKNPYLSTKHYDEHRLLSSIGAIPLSATETTAIDGLRYVGIDYCPVQSLHEKLDAVPECEVMCLHAGFKHLLGFEGAYDLTIGDIPVAVKNLVLVGHVHTHDTRQTQNGVTVASSGSTWIWRINETEKEHGIFIVDEKAGVDFIALDCRKYFEIDEIADIEDTQDEQHTLKPVLFYDPQTMPEVDNKQYPGVVLIPKGSEEAEVVEDIKEHIAVSLQEALEACVPGKEYPEQNKFIKGLLDADNPEAYIMEYLGEHKVTLKEVS